VKSWEVLQDAIDRVGVKAVAAKLKLSSALVYKWCQEPRSEDPDSSGAHNPLDRLQTLYELTGDPRLLNWLCQAGGGFFVPNPQAKPSEREEELLGTTQRVVDDFGHLLSDISHSIENDGRITDAEAEMIRESWERLKMHVECFVVACERGMYSGQAAR